MSATLWRNIIRLTYYAAGHTLFFDGPLLDGQGHPEGIASGPIWNFRSLYKRKTAEVPGHQIFSQMMTPRHSGVELAFRAFGPSNVLP
jgi:hypothetical protein